MRFRVLLLFTLSLALIASACSRRPRSTADVPRNVSQAYVVYVAPFTQPIVTGQLITGSIPEPQGRIPETQLPLLDQDMRSILSTETQRSYKFITSLDHPREVMHFHNAGQPQALPLWLAYGKKQGAQLLLVPLVLDWHEREGSDAGVTTPAHVRVEFFLINVDRGFVMSRSIFEEEQQGLVDNLLKVRSFFQRRGKWVTARQLCADGIRKAAKDLGL
ncbi:MAG: hypothetical protein IJU37_11230 [Desulfovibrio sp.]|nr:hypothetical protein [Desulfovibrio sp.]